MNNKILSVPRKAGKGFDVISGKRCLAVRTTHDDYEVLRNSRKKSAQVKSDPIFRKSTSYPDYDSYKFVLNCLSLFEAIECSTPHRNTRLNIFRRMQKRKSTKRNINKTGKTHSMLTKSCTMKHGP